MIRIEHALDVAVQRSHDADARKHRRHACNVTSKRPRGNGMGSSNARFQPRSATGLDRLAQPLHRELDILRLQKAPTLDLGLIAALGEALKVFRSVLTGRIAILGELLADEEVSWHRAI